MARRTQMTTTLTRAEAEALLASALLASNISEAAAHATARALVAAEIDGQGGHGLSRVSSYAAQAASGKVDGHAEPAISEDGAMLRVDVKGGFAFPAIDAAIEKLIPLTQSHGIAAAQFFHSHHCGQLGAHVERVAERGCVALMVANTPKAMAPWGGGKAVFGTNPIAFAAPRDGAPPLVIDLSLSKVARGKILAASKRGEAIPEGWVTDEAGEPITDPAKALGGTMVPAGDAKGAALALMVEVLAATLTGANHSADASSFFDGEGKPPGVGQLLIALRSGEGFGARLETLIASIEGQGARLPGSRRLAARETGADRLTVSATLVAEIKAISGV